MSIQEGYDECVRSCELGMECKSEECFTAGYQACLRDIETKYADKFHISDKSSWPSGNVILKHKIL